MDVGTENTSLSKALHASADQWLAKGSVITSVLAFMGASCCMLPVIFGSLGMSSIFLAPPSFLVQVKPFLIGLSCILIVSSIYLVHKRNQTSSRGMQAVLLCSGGFLFSTLLVIVFEREIITFMK